MGCHDWASFEFSGISLRVADTFMMADNHELRSHHAFIDFLNRFSPLILRFWKSNHLTVYRINVLISFGEM